LTNMTIEMWANVKISSTNELVQLLVCVRQTS
jgi:hypothetical protein